MSSQTAFLAATALHAGFQLTVTTLVYPALARVPANQWTEAHLAHSLAITPLVAVVYGSLAVTGAWVMLSRPGGWSIVALSAIATAAAKAMTANAVRILSARNSRLIVGRS